MDLLSTVSACSLFIAAHCQPPPVVSGAVSQWHAMVSQAASLFGLPDAWVEAVIARESAGQTSLNGRPITSKAGAMGLMQLMPETYEDLRRQYGLGSDAYAPTDNIFAGTAYLRQMYERYGYPGLFAAYNAGPGRFDAYLSGHKPLPDETISYLASIAPGAEMAFTRHRILLRKAQKPHAKDEIFVSQSTPSALFVTLSGNRR